MMRRSVRRWFRLPVSDAARTLEDVDAELAAHIEERVEQLMAAGMREQEARTEAERRLGGVDRARQRLLEDASERNAALSLREAMRSWVEDVRYATRAVFRVPAYAAVVIATLALGIGANATMFGVVDRLLLIGPAHVMEPENLFRFYVNIQYDENSDMETFAPLHGGALTAFREGVSSMDHVSGYTTWSLTLGSGTAARPLEVGAVSASLFPLLGVEPLVGRFFDEEDEQPPSGRRVVVLSHSIWQSEFGGRRDATGETLDLSGHRYTIIGVAPPGFTGVELEPLDAWVPLANRAAEPRSGWTSSWSGYMMPIVGRLRADASVARAEAEATRAWRRGYEGPMATLMRTATITLDDIRADRNGAEPMEARVARWLMAVTAIVLLVACANVANLYFARGLRRRREIAVRLTLGISRGRLVRLLLMESLVLAVLGGVAALVVAYWGAELVRTVLLPDVDWTSPPLNGRVLVVAGGLTAVVGVITGLIPALQAAGTRLAPSLTGSVHGPPAPGGIRSTLVVVQGAFCVILLVGAGLFVRSLWSVQGMDLGLDTDRLFQVWIDWDSPDARRDGFAVDAVDRVLAVPGVEQAAAGIGGAFTASIGTSMRAEGVDSVPGLPGGGPYLSAVSPGYFVTLGTRLVRGRDFGPADGSGTEPVVILSSTTAEHLWPGADPLGRCVHVGSDPACRRVVGLVEDVRRFAIEEDPALQLYVPLGQEPGFMDAIGTQLFVRTMARPERVVEAVRSSLYTMDPTIRYIDARPLTGVLAPQKRAWTLGAVLFTICGLLALAIAAIGLYSVIAYLVLHRTHEIGVRMALGAERRDIVLMVVRQALVLGALGLALGSAVALVTAPRLEPLLFDTAGRDVAVFAAAAATIALAALMAGLVPALRASRVQPTAALREL